MTQTLIQPPVLASNGSMCFIQAIVTSLNLRLTGLHSDDTLSPLHQLRWTRLHSLHHFKIRMWRSLRGLIMSLSSNLHYVFAGHSNNSFRWMVHRRCHCLDLHHKLCVIFHSIRICQNYGQKANLSEPHQPSAQNPNLCRWVADWVIDGVYTAKSEKKASPSFEHLSVCSRGELVETVYAEGILSFRSLRNRHTLSLFAIIHVICSQIVLLRKYVRFHWVCDYSLCPYLTVNAQIGILKEILSLKRKVHKSNVSAIHKMIAA